MLRLLLSRCLAQEFSRSFFHLKFFPIRPCNLCRSIIVPHYDWRNSPMAFKSSFAWCPRFVQMPPGCTLYDRSPCFLYLWASALLYRIFAVLDCAYDSHLSYAFPVCQVHDLHQHDALVSSVVRCHLTSKFQSSHRTGPPLYPLLERFTTLAPPSEARILPIISCVKRKWPKWFAWNWDSMPSSVSWYGRAIMPALLITTLIEGTSAQLLTSSDAFRTLLNELRSRTNWRVDVCGAAFLIASCESCKLEADLPARMMIFGDCNAIARAVSKPSPPMVTPVMRTGSWFRIF